MLLFLALYIIGLNGIHICQCIAMNSVPRLLTMDFSHKVVLDQLGSYTMIWSPQVDKIVIEVQVRNLGYVGLGFSPNGGMKGADIVIGWIDDEGIVHLSDRHGLGNMTPVEDESQDYQLLGGSRNETHTIIRFSRPWDTCDSSSDLVLTGDTVRVIWAYGTLQQDLTKTTVFYHDQNRGTKSLYLKEAKTIDPPSVTTVQTWDVRSPEVEVPGDTNTLYWCKLFKIPDLPWKHQIIGYVPIIQERNFPHVHHMLLYECSIDNSEERLEKWLGYKGAQCYTKNMPTSWRTCGAPIIAWAVGSEGEMLPEHVGFPLGETHGGATYFLLEIHYDNPNLKAGIIDHSGLRLILTDKVRQYDAGVLTMGHNVDPFMIVPPKRVWTTTGHCSSDCTQKTIPFSGINVYAGVLHAHLLGQSINVSHIRNGKELEPILADHNYDFNYQQARLVTPERIIRPGDHFITKCVYNSTKRTTPTYGGFGTEDEMCLAFLFYYPRINLSMCYSRPNIELLLRAFGIQNLYNYEKIVNTPLVSGFGKNSVHSFNDQSHLEMMKNVDQAGKNSRKFSLAESFKNFTISQPSRLRGKSFYEILSDESLWQNEYFLKGLEEAVSGSHYQPICLYSGYREVQKIQGNAVTPHFKPYYIPEQQCIPSSIEHTNLEPVVENIPPSKNWYANKFAWQVSIQWSFKSSRYHVCSSTIIGDQWVLTAAHCTSGFLIETLEFVAGDHLRDLEEGSEQVLRASKIFEHERFSPTTQENDITLAKMERPFVFDSVTVASVSLPSPKEMFEGYCVVSGWDKISDTETSNSIQKIWLPIISDETCQQKLRLIGYREAIKDTVLCTGFPEGGQNFCKGDSGGPLICQGRQNLPVLTGIVSWGIGCNTKNIPGVYTEVSQYVVWINRKITQEERQSSLNFKENSELANVWKILASGIHHWNQLNSLIAKLPVHLSQKLSSNPTLNNNPNNRADGKFPLPVSLKDFWNSPDSSKKRATYGQNSLDQVPLLVHALRSTEEKSKEVFSNPYKI